jgi:hypothetical protein
VYLFSNLIGTLKFNFLLQQRPHNNYGIRHILVQALLLFDDISPCHLSSFHCCFHLTVMFKSVATSTLLQCWAQDYNHSATNFPGMFNIIVGSLVTKLYVCQHFVCLFVVCFPGVTTHCGRIFHSPVAGFSLLVFEVS